MRSVKISLALLLLAAAQPSEFEESLGRPIRPPAVPAELRAMVREASTERLVVRGLAGGEIAVALGDVEAERLHAYADGRYLGFHFQGYEFFGYRLIDRRMTGEAAVIETGDAPVFSPDGRYFAAVQFSGADAGNLEGFGLWQVEERGSRQLLFNAAFPPGEDWRIDGWPREDCVALSAGQRNAGGEMLEARLHYWVQIGERLAIIPAQDADCNTANAVDAGND